MRKWGAVRWAWGLALFAVTSAAGCSNAATPNPAAAPGANAARTTPIDVVCTTGMVADLVRKVGGPHVGVTQLMGAGVDPHLYKAARDDVARMLAADIVVYSGLMLEGKMTDTLIKVGRTKPVYSVTELIDEKLLLTPDDAGGHFDPHVWMDVSAWAGGVEVVARALREFDPAQAADYTRNAAELAAGLEKLHAYGLKSIGSIPEKSRVLVSSHDAFNYFGRAYGIQVQGVQGISTESEAGLQRINELVDLLVSSEIPAVFVESSVPRKNIEALLAGARARGHAVRVGGTLFSDAMGAEGTYEGTYMGMLDHNITVVTRALGGDAPERGFQGKLQVGTE